MFTQRALSTALRAGAPRTPIATRYALSRSYAAAAAAPSSSATKPPVALFGIDGTYASALVRSPTFSSPQCPVPRWDADADGPIERG